MRVTVRYSPEEDRLEGDVDGLAKSADRAMEWSADARFLLVDKQVVGFEIQALRYFVDFLPFYKLFGPDFVGWLSDFQSAVTADQRSDSDDFVVARRTQSSERFERTLAAESLRLAG